MRLNLYVLLASLLFSLSLSAQESAECASHIVTERELEENQFFRRRLFNLERRLIRHHEEGHEPRSNDILVVPTVVHVIHTGEAVGSGTNISDIQIQSAITALNEDFRKMTGTNGDGEGVDVGIEFCLALRDPNGNSTNGIVRVDGSVVEDYAEQGIGVGQGEGADEVEVKSLSVWPREDYLNIWLVNEIENNDGGSGIQGFAYFPFNSVKDGVTIMHNAFGTVGNLKNFTDMNRTTTHEVGHFLGLYHTFHNSTDCSESNCETQGDRVCDTPVTVLNSSCNNPECNDTQQVENYMDYTGQACKNMFTEGQKVRMRYTLLEERSTLLDSQGCIPVSEYDASISSVNYPVGSLCNGNIFPEVTLTNYGGNTLTEVTIQYSVNNDAPQNFEWQGNLSPGASEMITLPIISVGGGNHIFYANTTAPNGQSDEFPNNDASQQNFIISTGVIAQVNVNLDYAGSENTWELTQNGVLMAEGGPYADNNPGLIMSHNVCLSPGCYDFTIYDDYGDGQGFLIGNYEVLDGEGNQVVFGQNNWGDSASHEFCLEAVQGDPPSADFSVSETTICAGESIDFTDLSSDANGWSWVFEGGNPSSSSDQNPQNISYDSPGTYDVTLTALNNFGSDVMTRTAHITVQTGPDIALTSSDVTCHGSQDGSASISVPSGTSISWSNGGSGQNNNGLSPGNYSVTASSSAGCESSLDFSITEPEELTLNIFKSDVTCHGDADGSASATVTGGTAPYSYSWSGGQSSVSNLTEGAYSLTVTDAMGCTISNEFVIIQPSEITVSINDITAETCVGSDGSATANGLGGTGDLVYSWSNGVNAQALTDVPFGVYDVTVTDATGCQAEATASIPYDCPTVLPTTQLVSSQCNQVGFSISDELMCNEVGGAEMYLWNFSDISGVTLEEAYTMGNNNTFRISDLNFVGYGDVLNVKIRIQKDDEWGEWGNSCSISILEAPPAISLLAEDCTAGEVAIGYTFQAEMNSGADEFEWLINTENGSMNFYTYVDQFTITEELMLTPGEAFSVQLRALYGDIWSPYGAECFFTYEIVDNIMDWGAESAVQMQIYPNPNSGEEFSIEIDNLPVGNDVIEITVFDTNGRLIESWLKEINGNTLISETYSFNSKLSKGMYLIQVGSEGHMRQEKLIVK